MHSSSCARSMGPAPKVPVRHWQGGADLQPGHGGRSRRWRFLGGAAGGRNDRARASRRVAARACDRGRRQRHQHADQRLGLVRNVGGGPERQLRHLPGTAAFEKGLTDLLPGRPDHPHHSSAGTGSRGLDLARRDGRDIRRVDHGFDRTEDDVGVRTGPGRPPESRTGCWRKSMASLLPPASSRKSWSAQGPGDRAALPRWN